LRQQLQRLQHNQSHRKGKKPYQQEEPS